MAKITVLKHVLALLGEMDLRYRQRFEAQNLAIDAARIAADKAIAKAEAAAEKRFENVSELQHQSDQSAGRGRGLSIAWGVVIAVVGIAVAAAALFIKGTHA